MTASSPGLLLTMAHGGAASGPLADALFLLALLLVIAVPIIGVIGAISGTRHLLQKTVRTPGSTLLAVYNLVAGVLLALFVMVFIRPDRAPSVIPWLFLLPPVGLLFIAVKLLRQPTAL